MESQARGKAGAAEPVQEQARGMLSIFLRFAPPLLLVAVLAVALIWRFASGQGPSAPKAAATVVPAATATPNTQPLDMRVAWGNVAVHTLPTALPDNRALVFEQAATAERSPRGRYSGR